MRLRWLLPGILSVWCLLAAVAEAANLNSWRFDRRQNRLELNTDVGVQPQAQIIYNPTRLIIDLPGTRLGKPKQTEVLGGNYAAMRIAQFDRGTTRIVIELAPGYVIDPSKVKFRYSSARNWTIELPSPDYSPAIATNPDQKSRDLDVPKAPGVAPVSLFPPAATAPTPGGSGPIVNTPAGKPIVVIDPGHGGPDPGAVGIGGLKETDIVLDIGRQVTTLLERQGIGVILTRSGEYDLGLEPRVQMANRANATIFVSIHANAISMSRPDVNGLETYYYDSGKALADTVHQTLLQDIGSLRDRRVRSARFYVLRRSSMPSILIETGFVTGAEDAARLSDPQYRSQMAASIARGILRYLGRG